MELKISQRLNTSDKLHSPKLESWEESESQPDSSHYLNP
jgi:hypothetical protein